MDIESYIDIFKKFGNPAEEYMRNTYPRYCKTKKILTDSWPENNTKRMLDIGAHWLHQAVLYAMDGFKVTAADLYTDEKNPVIMGIAQEYAISMVEYKDLSDPQELQSLPENSFDLILFSEILEHITFNPVKMWTQLYRLLSEGGRIIVTTPNYFNYKNGYFVMDILNVFSGRSAGIKIPDILEINTYGHHWRIFSAKDVVEYFSYLSPDFAINRIEYFDYYHTGKGLIRYCLSNVQKVIPCLREGLYVEITLQRKDAGIIVTPHW
jgi:2-polyprenyl-3-methyl-5-hydroxy-6-metoxy-1,4-benzoquinol methylase